MPSRHFVSEPTATLKRLAATFAMACAALTGCSDIGDNGNLPNATMTTLTVTPSLGLVRDADVIVRDARDAVVGSGTTGSTGTASIRVPGSGPWVVTVAGNARAEYFDENLGTFVGLPAGAEIRALVPAGTTTFTVSGLTELAHALWKSEPGLPLTASNIASANQSIRRAFANAALMGSILDVPLVPAATPATGSLNASAASLHAVLLAALADIGQGQPAPALAAISRLRDDLADGDIDNAGDTGPLTGTPLYLETTFSSDFTALLNVRRGQWGDSTLQASPVELLPLPAPAWFGPGTPAGSLPATLADALQDNRNMLFQRAEAVPEGVPMPLRHGSTYAIGIRAGGVLAINNIEYRFPYQRYVNGSLAYEEINWSTGDGFEFALSDNALGLFNTLKLYSLESETGARAALLGQLLIGGDWAEQASILTGGINAITWANGLFVAVGNGRKIITSSDGINWAASTPPVTAANWTTFNAVTHDGNLFIAVGDTSDSNVMPPVIATSGDGVAWVAREWTPRARLAALVDVTAAGGRISAVGNNGAVVSSVDGGVTWRAEVQNTQNLGAGIASNGSTRVMVGSGTLAGIAGANQILANSGTGWRSVVSDLGFALNSVVYTGTQFIAIGYRAATTGSGDSLSSNTLVLTSPDGEAWTMRSYLHDEIPSRFWMRRMFHDGSRTYAVGDRPGQQLIISSADGVTWDEEFLGLVTGPGSLTGIAASPERTIAVGPTRFLSKD
jgi:hypothetical protein